MAQCSEPVLAGILGQSTVDTITSVLQPATSGAQVPAPPCKQQDKYTFQGKTSQYPKVDPLP